MFRNLLRSHQIRKKQHIYKDYSKKIVMSPEDESVFISKDSLRFQDVMKKADKIFTYDQD